MSWTLSAADESRPDRGRSPMRLSFEENGEALGIALSAADAAAVRRLLAPYVARACQAVVEPTDLAQVRRWASANGHEVAPRGRIARRVLDAYNAATGSAVTDRSGRQRPAVVTLDEIERRKAAASTPSIMVTTVLVDESGIEHPWDPALLRPALPGDG